MGVAIDTHEIRHTIEVLKPDGELFEVRVVDDKSATYSGYFKDADVLINALNQIDLRGCNVYLSLGEITEACYSRKQRDKFIKGAKATSDADIEGYEWIMVDFDPIRPSGTSSSATELEESKNKMVATRRFLKERGFNDPVVAISGNGYHLLYKAALGNTTENKELIKRFLKTLDALFSDDAVTVDVSVSNPARTCKLYGTMAQKGLDTEERPHRMSKVLRDGAQEPTSKAYFESVCSLINDETDKRKYNNYSPQEFDLEGWLSKYDIRWKAKSAYGTGTKYTLEHCPFNENHTGTEAVIFQLGNGAISFVCKHNSCSDKRWQDVRMMYEPDYQERKWKAEEKLLYGDYNRRRKRVEVELPREDEEMGVTIKGIVSKPRQAQTYIKTGITEFDRNQRGMKKRGILLLSGYTGGAKSTLLSQIMLNAVNDGYHVSCFSGEFADEDFADWIIQQAAGKSNVEPGKYDGYYNVPIEIKNRVADWFSENLMVYKNGFGFSYSTIMEFCRREVEKRSADLICLDNLMAFDITELNDNEIRAQTDFIWRLHEFAMQNNVAIVLVAHPKKTGGLLNWQDISGSSNIVNAIDTLAFIYRVDQSFKNYYAEFYNIPRMRGKGEDESPVDEILRERIGDATNVISVKKARFGRVTDDFTPLWYEKESMRLKNSKSENRHYGWETGKTGDDGFIDADENPFA